MTDKPVNTQLVGTFNVSVASPPILATVAGEPDHALVSLSALGEWISSSVGHAVRSAIAADREQTRLFVIADLARKGHLKNAPEVLDGPLDAFADRLAESLANALASVEQRTAIVSMPPTTATVRRDARGDLVGIDAEPTA